MFDQLREGDWKGIEKGIGWVSGKAVIFEYDPMRLDRLCYNVIDLPEEILDKEFVKELKKRKEPLNLKK